MIARGYAGWLRQETPDARWQSFGVSLLLTLALFGSAFLAMQRIAPWHAATERIEPTEVVRLTPPAPIVTPRVTPKPSTTPAPTTTVAPPRSVPTALPPAVVTPAQPTATPLTSSAPIVA